MKLMFYALVLAVGLTLSIGSPLNSIKKYYCGRQLAKILIKVCSSFSDRAEKGPLQLEKRDVDVASTNYEDEKLTEGGGIVNDCCYNPCSLDVVAIYC
ncbi:hypothetical protein K1T71_009882 [Dendrolimus kikuchii]|uniref:Uncharacterized protein n=1 Tax=Dendrolimus kikuchii TaxID=765133 RepID=A0ACC1CTM7_9NEOP|nr:hypothetical protein K1T71_009882 [Dendrolimus kikuchii]